MCVLQSNSRLCSIARKERNNLYDWNNTNKTQQIDEHWWAFAHHQRHEKRGSCSQKLYCIQLTRSWQSYSNKWFDGLSGRRAKKRVMNSLCFMALAAGRSNEKNEIVWPQCSRKRIVCSSYLTSSALRAAFQLDNFVLCIRNERIATATAMATMVTVMTVVALAVKTWWISKFTFSCCLCTSRVLYSSLIRSPLSHHQPFCHAFSIHQHFYLLFRRLPLFIYLRSCHFHTIIRIQRLRSKNYRPCMLLFQNGFFSFRFLRSCAS